MTPLAQGLLDAGLIQFGWFEGDAPFAQHLDMLAAYPRLLEAAADEAQAALSNLYIERLLCSADSIPLGVAYGLRSGIPLVYSRGTSEPPVFDLVGAYDIGHPTLLISHALDAPPTTLINGARRVGLQVHTLLTILEIRPQPPADFTLVPLLRLADLVGEMRASSQLPPAHAQAVLDWIAG